MLDHKEVIEKYMDGFNKSDHEQILSCLTEDVEWILPGVFHIVGKDAFDKEIENEAFVGSPRIVVTRMIEDGNMVVAEGTVSVEKKSGGFLKLVFCDVFTMKSGKIKQLISYLMEIK